MDLLKEYEQYQQAQRDAPMLAAAAQARNSTTSDRARAARARDLADPERLLKRVAEAQAKEARFIDRIVPSDVQSALLSLMRREIKSLLPHPLRGLTDNFTDDAAPLMASLDAQGQAYWGPAPEEGDYAFKITAVEALDVNGDPYDPPKFTVKVLGGTAQTLGGTPHFYEDVEIPDAEDGDYIFLRYQNVDDSNWTEIGTWDSDVHHGTAAYIENTGGAPFDLIFVIGRVGSDYAGFVRQDHKGGIVMPAISNVVDIQTQLP